MGDGYLLEVTHFAKAVAGKSVPMILTPAQSCDSVKLIEAEKKSAHRGKKVSYFKDYERKNDDYM
jgi:hypothetical protein